MSNKTIPMTIAQIEKSSLDFKKTHKIKVSGPYDEEETPKWFKEYAEKTDARLKRLEEEIPKWFKEYAQKTDARLKHLEEETPKWFKEYAEKTDARLKSLENQTPPKYFVDFANEMRVFVKKQMEFNEFVIRQFKEHEWIKK